MLATILFLVYSISAQSTNNEKTGVCKDINYKALITMGAKLDRVISMFNSDKITRKSDQAAMGAAYIDCKHVLDSDVSRGSGVYTIFNPVDPLQKREVYCDMETEGGGWLVLQRRVSGSVNFNRGWAEYVTGFGDVTGNVWLGNELLHRLTNYRPQELRVDLENFDNVTAYAKYQEFKVDSGTNKYKLSVSGYSGSAGDSLSYHNGANFCTKDKDYDTHDSLHCASALEGAWWFKSCETSSLNGPYYQTETIEDKHYHGVSWDDFGGERSSLKMSEMKIRPK